MKRIFIFILSLSFIFSFILTASADETDTLTMTAARRLTRDGYTLGSLAAARLAVYGITSSTRVSLVLSLAPLKLVRSVPPCRLLLYMTIVRRILLSRKLVGD